MVAPGHFPAVKRVSDPARPEVQRQMALHAIEYLHLRKLANTGCACELGYPCQDCVIDAMWLREYRKVLAAVDPLAAG